jgi:chromosome partitioning protein
MPTTVVSNQKGGVGKTTLTFNLAKGLAAKGKKVLAVDNDPQGNLTGSFLENPQEIKANVIDLYSSEASPVQPHTVNENLDFIGANIHLARVAEGDFDVIFRLREGLERLPKAYDVVLIDCLPSFGYLHMAALNAADNVFIPVKPAPYALSGLKDLFDTIARTQKRTNETLSVVGIALNFVEPTVLAKQMEEVLREEYKELVFEARVGKAVRLEESPTFFQSVMEYHPESKTAEEMNALIDEFARRVGL